MVKIYPDKECYDKLIESYPICKKEIDEFIGGLINRYDKINFDSLSYPFGWETDLTKQNIAVKNVFIDKIKEFILMVCEIPESKEEIKEEKLKSWLYKDMINFEPPKQEWIIENQIPVGEIGLLVGKRGERKTFIALYQAVCIASGLTCFNDNIPKKRKVLYIDEEAGIYELVRRIKSITKGLEIEKEPLDICIISQEGLMIDLQEDSENINVRRLEKMNGFNNLLEEFKPDLIIVDCLQRCLSFNVDKENEKMSAVFTGIIRQISNKYSCSWLFIHHLRKSLSNYKAEPDDMLDEVRGASEIVNFSRFVLMCQVPKNQENNESEKAIFRILKMSNAQKSEPKAINFISSDNILKIEYLGVPADVLSSERLCANAIRTWLVDNQITREFRTKEIIEADIGYKKSLISLGLNVLLKEGFLTKVKRGIYQIKGEISQSKLS